MEALSGSLFSFILWQVSGSSTRGSEKFQATHPRKKTSSHPPFFPSSHFNNTKKRFGIPPIYYLTKFTIHSGHIRTFDLQFPYHQLLGYSRRRPFRPAKQKVINKE